MKKIMLVFLIVSVFLLAGCGSKNIEQPQNEIDDVQIENETSLEEEKDSNLAETAIINALKDSEWVKENVTMKKTCFGDDFTLPQEMTFEILRDDMAIVQAFAYETDVDLPNFGTQVFLVGYFDGGVKVIYLPEEAPAHPGHAGFGIDSENMILVYYWMHQGVVKNTAYDINDFSFEKIDLLELDSMDENSERLIQEFNQKYDTHSIETPLTEEDFNY